MNLWSILIQSLWNRRLAVGLTLLTIALSIALLLSVSRIQSAARQSFERSISGTDLLVGARGSDLQILLYSVFGLGGATNNFRYSSYQALEQNSNIEWMVPISLGDSHRGFRVVGTNTDYFQRVKYGRKQSIAMQKGAEFSDLFEVVIGAQVAKQLGYDLGASLVLTHGTQATGPLHDDLPFVVSGILAPTGTPIDQSLYVSLEAIEAIHVGWETGRKLRNQSAEVVANRELEPQQLTAALVGLKSQRALFKTQRTINKFRGEPLTAVLPGVALAQLWSIVGTAEQAFRLISILIVTVAILGMIATTLTSLDQRRREMAIFRSLGASAGLIAFLFVAEAMLIAVLACLTGLGFVSISSWLGASWAQKELGLILDPPLLSSFEAYSLAGILAGAFFASLVPAIMSYRATLHDGLTVRQ